MISKTKLPTHRHANTLDVHVQYNFDFLYLTIQLHLINVEPHLEDFLVQYFKIECPIIL